MISPTEYDQLDGLAMAALVRTGQLTPADLCAAAIARAEAVNPKLNAVVYPLYEQARRRAAAGLPAGPFGGVPFLLKDFGAQYTGAPHTSGSRALRNFVPTEDAELVCRWQAAGLNILGKTNTPEFALMGVTEPTLHGPTRNPWHLGHTPGGSSGGAAAAVAAGITPVAGAGDGGGSIRIPAACCGLFGLKPSRGRVPTGPEQGEKWQGAAVEHVLSRSVRDSAALLDATQGPDVGAPYFLPNPARSYLEEASRAPGRLRVGFSLGHPLGSTLHPECATAVRDAARLLESLGHDVAEVPLPFDGRAVATAFLMLYFGETGASIAALAKVLGRPARPRDVEPTTWLLSLLGRTYTAADFAAARHTWNDSARRMGRFHQTYDLLLTPTLATPPVRIGELQPKSLEQTLLKVVNTFGLGGLIRRSGIVEKLAEQSLEKTPYTQVANLTGQPAMSVPLHWTADGLPCGVQFIASLGAEDVLFRLAGQLEQAQPWFDKRPALVG
ncbi:6-aminohexanoate-cyclic-dimer hydrolase [Hymenobacter frigidus]|uniref:6-aminohexanoate-cyclic-dimer hydrolase n=1 Tax=Hymenobacter frigidus TaxID=1524095 RepID=A0ABQ2A765_9BACT|nr:amidase family protein [Hymenobacter frigidus]GGH85520.1 6-aminohexanoate-cyclic-dimer hydrolase [Hymenobacter frigidus]